MAAPPPDARVCRSELISVRPTGDDGVVIRVRPSIEIAPLRAGRFFMLRRDDDLSPAIPRPFSIYRQRGEELEFLIKVVGPGTRALAQSRPGEPLFTLGPLGRGWPEIDAEGPPWVMIGGGVGVAPHFMAAEEARRARAEATLILGGREAGQLYDLERFVDLDLRVLAATDDGSIGFEGTVLDCLEHQWHEGELPPSVRILGCGPDPMLRALTRLARERGLECWLSLERMMGCGVGICNGCIVETDPDGPLGEWPVAKCCVDGPIFRCDAIRE